MRKYLLIFLSLILFLPNLFYQDINPVLSYNKIERFNPNFSYLNTVNKVEEHIDSIAAGRSISSGTVDYVEIAANTLRDRFYHGFSHFSLNENWIAATCGRFIWYDLSCKVKADDILKYSYAGCSQQGIVMITILRDKHIPYRSVLFPHHYAVEAMINNKWYYFDTNMEPNISGEARWSRNWYNSADSLKHYYNKVEFTDLDSRFGINHPILYGNVNEMPASHARLFGLVTGVLSKIAWLFPLLLLFYLERKRSQKASASN